VYGPDLARIHDSGFGDLARDAAPEVIRVLRAHGIHPAPRRSTSPSRPAPRIVEIGCGSGILARRLVDAGYDAVGIDQSAAMIRLARSKAPGATFLQGSLTRAAIPPCRAVIAMGEVVSYVRTDLAPFFRRVAAALEPGGVFLFDFMESAKHRTYRTKMKRGAGWTLGASASVDESGRLLTRRLTTLTGTGQGVRRSAETHRLRIRSRAEIARDLRATGFRIRMRRSYGRHRLIAGDVAVIAVRGV
jgi:SAM-dependent methyltransferase